MTMMINDLELESDEVSEDEEEPSPKRFRAEVGVEMDQ